MIQSRAERLGLTIDGQPLTYTNVRPKLFNYANLGYPFQDVSITRQVEEFNWNSWPREELIKILEVVLVDDEFNDWWRRQLAIVTNCHYTAPEEIADDHSKLILENGLEKLSSEQLRHLATSPSQLMQMYWEINDSYTEAWIRPKVRIGKELLGLTPQEIDDFNDEQVILPSAPINVSKFIPFANAASKEGMNVDEDKPSFDEPNAPPVITPGSDTVAGGIPVSLDGSNDEVPRDRDHREIEKDGWDEEDEEPSE